jgi:predicted ribosome quality control (RQC) complex YloA/Tae2 family protein
MQRIENEWTVIARSRNQPLDKAVLPDGTRAPPDLPARDESLLALPALAQLIQSDLDSEAFEQRTRAAEQALKDSRKSLLKKHAAALQAAHDAEEEPDYRNMGTVLTSILHSKPKPVDRGGKRYWTVPDYETGELKELEGSPTLDAKAQAERYFHLARRKERRLEEGLERAATLEKNISRLDKALQSLPKNLERAEDWKTLGAAETIAGISTAVETGTPGSKREKPRLWSGRTFTSKDGLPILVGKTRDENLELTFKVARGNDVWMHLRGRPGAHVVIPVQSGKSTPLETLLDAAVLTVFYSGGEK